MVWASGNGSDNCGVGLPEKGLVLPQSEKRTQEAPYSLPNRNQDATSYVFTAVFTSIIKLVIWKLHSATENPQVSTTVLASGRSNIQGNEPQAHFHLRNLVGIPKHRSPLTG